MKTKLRKPISVKIVKPERTDLTHKSPTPNCDTREDLAKVQVRFDRGKNGKQKENQNRKKEDQLIQRHGRPTQRPMVLLSTLSEN